MLFAPSKYPHDTRWFLSKNLIHEFGLKENPMKILLGLLLTAAPMVADEQNADERTRQLIRLAPLLSVVDLNRDGSVSAEELEKAVESIRSIDRNGDGTIQPEERSLRAAVAFQSATRAEDDGRGDDDDRDDDGRDRRPESKGPRGDRPNSDRPRDDRGPDTQRERRPDSDRDRDPDDDRRRDGERQDGRRPADGRLEEIKNQVQLLLPLIQKRAIRSRELGKDHPILKELDLQIEEIKRQIRATPELTIPDRMAAQGNPLSKDRHDHDSMERDGGPKTRNRVIPGPGFGRREHDSGKPADDQPHAGKPPILHRPDAGQKGPDHKGPDHKPGHGPAPMHRMAGRPAQPMRLHAAGGSPGIVAILFRLLDADHNGSLSLPEFQRISDGLHSGPSAPAGPSMFHSQGPRGPRPHRIAKRPQAPKIHGMSHRPEQPHRGNHRGQGGSDRPDSRSKQEHNPGPDFHRGPDRGDNKPDRNRPDGARPTEVNLQTIESDWI